MKMSHAPRLFDQNFRALKRGAPLGIADKQSSSPKSVLPISPLQTSDMDLKPKMLSREKFAFPSPPKEEIHHAS
jgi:hypothetical protein